MQFRLLKQIIQLNVELEKLYQIKENIHKYLENEREQYLRN